MGSLPYILTTRLTIVAMAALVLLVNYHHVSAAIIWHLPFEGDVKDYGPAGNHGTLSNPTANYFVPDSCGKNGALRFSASILSYVSLPGSKLAGMRDFSFMFRIWKDTSCAAENRYIFSIGTTTTSQDMLVAFGDTGGPGLNFKGISAGTVTSAALAGVNYIAFAVVRKGSSVSIYVDGVLGRTYTVSAAIGTAITAYIGQDQDGPAGISGFDTNQAFCGDVDHLRWEDTARDANWVKRTNLLPRCNTEQLLVHYEFDSLAKVADYSGHRQNGTWVNGAGRLSLTPNGIQTTFNSHYHRGHATWPAAAILHRLQDWTFSFWVRRSANAGAGNTMTIMSVASTLSAQELAFQVNRSGHLIVVQADSSEGTAVQLPLNQWRHITITCNLAKTERRYYVNGVFRSVYNTPNIVPLYVDVSHGVFGQNIETAGTWSPSTFLPQKAFNGSITEFRVYGYTLTLNEIRGVYNQSRMLRTRTHSLSVMPTRTRSSTQYRTPPRTVTQPSSKSSTFSAAETASVGTLSTTPSSPFSLTLTATISLPSQTAVPTTTGSLTLTPLPPRTETYTSSDQQTASLTIDATDTHFTSPVPLTETSSHTVSSSRSRIPIHASARSITQSSSLPTYCGSLPRSQCEVRPAECRLTTEGTCVARACEPFNLNNRLCILSGCQYHASNRSCSTPPLCSSLLSSPQCRAHSQCRWASTQALCVADNIKCETMTSQHSCTASDCAWNAKATPTKCYKQILSSQQCATITSSDVCLLQKCIWLPSAAGQCIGWDVDCAQLPRPSPTTCGFLPRCYFDAFTGNCALVAAGTSGSTVEQLQIVAVDRLPAVAFPSTTIQFDFIGTRIDPLRHTVFIVEADVTSCVNSTANRTQLVPVPTSSVTSEVSMSLLEYDVLRAANIVEVTVKTIV